MENKKKAKMIFKWLKTGHTLQVAANAVGLSKREAKLIFIGHYGHIYSFKEDERTTSYTKTSLVGQRSGLKKLEDCLDRNEHCLIFGRSGIGKTSSVHELCELKEMTIVEINASDYRSLSQISKMMYGSQETDIVIDSKGIVYLFDEADGLTQNAVVIMEEILRTSVYPCVFTVNNYKKFPDKLKKLVKLIRYNPITYEEIQDYIKENTIKDDIGYPVDYAIPEILITVTPERVKECRGDMRKILGMGSVIKEEIELTPTNIAALLFVKEDRFELYSMLDKPKYRRMIHVIISRVNENLPRIYRDMEDLLYNFRILKWCDIYKFKINIFSILVFGIKRVKSGRSLKPVSFNFKEWKKNKKQVVIMKPKKKKRKSKKKKVSVQRNLGSVFDLD